MRPLFLFFVVLPFIELYVMIEIGAEIGGLNVIFLILLSGVLGMILMRSQGIATLQKAQQLLSVGQPPEKEMLEGILIFMGGMLLVIPGFITDSFGLLLLIPPIRTLMIKQVINQKRRQGRYYEENVFEGEFEEKPQTQQTLHHETIIEGEVIDVKEQKKP